MYLKTREHTQSRDVIKGHTSVLLLVLITNINTNTNGNTNTTHSFLRAERRFSSLTWWLGSERLTSGSESDRLLGISSSSKSLLS